MIKEKNFPSGIYVIKIVTNWRLNNSLFPSATQVSLFNIRIAEFIQAVSRTGKGLAASSPLAVKCHKLLT